MTHTELWIWLLVGVGTPIGALARYGISLGVIALAGTTFPYATLLVNISGSFLIGLLAAWTAGTADSAWFALLGTGVLGGYTTYSTFSLENLALLEEGRVRAALLYIALSFLVCVAATGFGVWLGGGIGS